jgi:CRP-like cAMP-binding protein
MFQMIHFLSAGRHHALEEVTLVKSEWNANDFNMSCGCRVLEGCGAEEAQAFLTASDAKVFEFAGGEEIPRTLRSHCWAIVMNGSVRLFSGGESGSVLLNVAGCGDAFDIASLTGQRSQAPASTAVAACKCRVAFLTACDIRALMRDYPSIAANCFAFFTERIAFLNRRIRTLSCGTAEEKLADFLLTECCHEDGAFTVKLKSCVELADRLNISRASLYRVLGALETAGIISRTGKVITIRDWERLAAGS